jgi:hypothetical protein
MSVKAFCRLLAAKDSLLKTDSLAVVELLEGGGVSARRPYLSLA